MIPQRSYRCADKFLVEEVKFLPRFLHDDVLQADDVWVLQLLEERDFPDGGGWDSLFFALQSDLLHGHDLIRALVAALEDNSVRACNKEGAVELEACYDHPRNSL